MNMNCSKITICLPNIYKLLKQVQRTGTVHKQQWFIIYLYLKTGNSLPKVLTEQKTMVNAKSTRKITNT